jgi:DNA primase
LGAKYLIDRGIYDYIDAYWSPHTIFRNRVIIPFWQGDKIVGYTGRDFTGKAEAKYMNKSPKNFLYNIDAVKRNKRYLIVTEGVIDAACLDGVGVMSNEASPAQIDYINQFKGEVILSPDRDKAGERLIKQAIENGWSVSFPRWEDEIKDAADAVNKYGKLYTLKSIIDGRISNSTKINVKMRLG